ncbi:MAG: hypothetical protein J6S80_03845 [Alphaproteobacteria bacterium]|nr:hypothetical protein [Alphaproteobacteria bacterium]
MKFSYTLLFGAIASIIAFEAFAVSKTVTTQGYVDTKVATKQDKLTGSSGYAVTYGSSAGTTGSRQIVTSLGTSTTATTLPTTGAVVSGLNGKQGTINGPANSVVTYTGSSGGTSSQGVYQASGSYSSQTDSLAEAGHVNTAVTNAFNAHITCGTYATPGDTTSDCLLWNVNNLSGTYMPQNQ